MINLIKNDGVTPGSQEATSSEFTDPNHLGDSSLTVGNGAYDNTTNLKDHMDGINSFLNSEIMPKC